MVDVEEPAPHRATDGARRRPHADPHDGPSEPALGRAANPWLTAETRDRRLSGDRREYIGRRRQPPSQTCRTFLQNHVGQIVAADFSVVPTATYRLVFVLVLLAHDRRRIRHIAVTAHPTAAWTAQQLREACPWDEAPRYLIHDRDHAFDGLEGPQRRRWGLKKCSRHHARLGKTRSSSDHWIRSSRVFRSRDRVQRSGPAPADDPLLFVPRAVAYAFVAGQRYAIPRPVTRPEDGPVVAIPEVGGLHHRYQRRAA
jgi:putative transposase